VQDRGRIANRGHLLPAFAMGPDGRLATTTSWPPSHFTLMHACFRGLSSRPRTRLAAGMGSLREPRKPRAPAEDCAIRFPSNR
jgi:hypothetical protein